MIVRHERKGGYRKPYLKTKFVCNCTRDGSRPSGAALQEEASNHFKLHGSKARVVSVKEKVL